MGLLVVENTSQIRREGEILADVLQHLLPRRLLSSVVLKEQWRTSMQLQSLADTFLEMVNSTEFKSIK